MAVSSFNIQDAYQLTARTKFRSEITNHQPQGSGEVFRHGRAWRATKQETMTSFHYTRKLENNEMGGACNMCVGEERRIQGFGGGNLRERDHLEDPGLDGKIILRCIFRKWDVGVKTGPIWLMTGNMAGTFECGNEP